MATVLRAVPMRDPSHSRLVAVAARVGEPSRGAIRPKGEAVNRAGRPSDDTSSDLEVNVNNRMQGMALGVTTKPKRELCGLTEAGGCACDHDLGPRRYPKRRGYGTHPRNLA
jgi:hypothetical protein